MLPEATRVRARPAAGWRGLVAALASRHVRRSTYSRSRIWIEAAIGMATIAPSTPSSVPPNSTATIVMSGWTFTVRFWIWGWIRWFSICW